MIRSPIATLLFGSTPTNFVALMPFIHILRTPSSGNVFLYVLSSLLQLVKNTTINLEHQIAKNNILQASRRQHKRYKSDTVFNSDLNSRQLSQLPTESAALSFLKDAAEKLNLSARTYFKTIKVAQTIADLDQQDFIKQEHIAEALLYRQTLPTV